MIDHSGASVLPSWYRPSCWRGAAPAMAQACTRQGVDVTCDDGRRGIFRGDAIIWADGTRSSLASPHPSVIIGNKSSVVIGPGVFVGQGKGVRADGESERAEQGARARSWMACRIVFEGGGRFIRVIASERSDAAFQLFAARHGRIASLRSQ